MNNSVYDRMLSAYDLSTEQQRRNAIFEVNQQVILAGLYNGVFFDMAAFTATFFYDALLRTFGFVCGKNACIDLSGLEESGERPGLV